MGKFADRLGRKKQAAQGKISDRLLEFAEPMIAHAQEHDDEPTIEDMESLLKVAITVWNAKVFEQLGRGSHYVEEVKRVIGSDPDMPPVAKDMIEGMLVRKDEVFPDDLRTISDFEIFETPAGELRLRVESRLAAELLHEH